ncbi:MAG: hypothetical protein RR357_03285 [Clostridia bacterium]
MDLVSLGCGLINLIYIIIGILYWAVFGIATAFFMFVLKKLSGNYCLKMIYITILIMVISFSKFLIFDIFAELLSNSVSIIAYSYIFSIRKHLISIFVLIIAEICPIVLRIFNRQRKVLWLRFDKVNSQSNLNILCSFGEGIIKKPSFNLLA